MRRNFATILKEAKVNIQDEYARLYSIFYDKYLFENGNNFSFYDLIEASFSGFWFRGTCVSLADFNETHEFSFELIDFLTVNLIFHSRDISHFF